MTSWHLYRSSTRCCRPSTYYVLCGLSLSQCFNTFLVCTSSGMAETGRDRPRYLENGAKTTAGSPPPKHSIPIKYPKVVVVTTFMESLLFNTLKVMVKVVVMVVVIVDSGQFFKMLLTLFLKAIFSEQHAYVHAWRATRGRRVVSCGS